ELADADVRGVGGGPRRHGLAAVVGQHPAPLLGPQRPPRRPAPAAEQGERGDDDAGLHPPVPRRAPRPEPPPAPGRVALGRGAPLVAGGGGVGVAARAGAADRSATVAWSWQAAPAQETLEGPAPAPALPACLPPRHPLSGPTSRLPHSASSGAAGAPRPDRQK